MILMANALEHEYECVTQIKLIFENNEINECDYLIISDGVFSKSKSLISNNQTQPIYNDTLAIRGILKKSPENIDKKNMWIRYYKF